MTSKAAPRKYGEQQRAQPGWSIANSGIPFMQALDIYAHGFCK
jgi:hypothetical protein